MNLNREEFKKMVEDTKTDEFAFLRGSFYAIRGTPKAYLKYSNVRIFKSIDEKFGLAGEYFIIHIS